MHMMTSALAGTALGSFLVSNAPVTSQSSIMHPVLEHVPVLPSPDWGLIQANQPDEIEHLPAKEPRGQVGQLTKSLGCGKLQIIAHESILEASNAQLVIQNIFVRKQSTALHAKENKKSKGGTLLPRITLKHWKQRSSKRLTRRMPRLTVLVPKKRRKVLELC
jgi:hypothetical protein